MSRRDISSAYRKAHTRRQHPGGFTGSVTRSRPVRATARRTRIRRRRAGALVAVVALAAAVNSASEGSASLPSLPVLPTASPAAELPRASADDARDGWRDALGDAGGDVPDGTTVFDDALPGVANLESDLLGALRQAAADAPVDFVVNSGWRSEAYQEHLLREAVAQYGSKAEASRWVATPDTSPHVSGHAVDIGPTAAAAWLSEHGAAYGLCQIYGNEPWHFELRPDAVGQGCPPTYADPTHDPRMQQ